MSNPDPEWILVYSSNLPHKVSIVKAVLEDNQIRAFEINKTDSAYISIGSIDLFVNRNDAVLAEFIIKKNEL